jgi:hypothetical protein
LEKVAMNQMTRQGGRPEAAEVIWRWREPTLQASGQGASKARIAGTIQGFIGAGVAVAIYLLWSHTIGTIVFSISAATLLSALVSPLGLYRIIDGVFRSLGTYTGRMLTWLTLVPMFYLFFLPFGLLFRRGRRDRMKRFFEPNEASYWEPHKPFSAADHQRQF